MPTRTSYDPGTFCWVDTIVADPQAAIAFYGEVFGWGATDTGMSYWLLTKDGQPVAGLTQLTSEMREQGMPPVWGTSVSVVDVDDAVARVEALGGTVTAPAMDVPDTGRMAFVADPQGAAFLLWQARPFVGAALVNEPGAWSWSDLQSHDPEGVAPFYQGLFGWTIAPVPGSEGQYFTINNAGRAIGGIMLASPQIKHPFWATYIGTDDIDATIAAVQAAGGQHLAGPFTVPAGRFAAVADPQGAMFSLVEGVFDD